MTVHDVINCIKEHQPFQSPTIKAYLAGDRYEVFVATPDLILAYWVNIKTGESWQSSLLPHGLPYPIGAILIYIKLGGENVQPTTAIVQTQ